MSTFEDLLARIDRFPERVHTIQASDDSAVRSDCERVFKQDLFYLFLTLDEGWVQVSLETGLRLLQYLV